MTQIDMNTVRAMADAGIEFAAQVPAPGGSATFSLRSEEVAEFVADPCAFYAKTHGASKDEYLGWLETDGRPRCCATTSTGQRCRNSIAGTGQLPLHLWIQGFGGFCTRHSTTRVRAARAR